jgi:adenine-specific DNA methylase
MNEVFFQMDLEENKKALEELRSHFDPEKHCYSISLTAYYPPKIFRTKKGTISAKTHDITNWEKSIVDCLFLKKHHENGVPFGANNLNTDDKYIVDMVSKKRPSTDNTYSIVAEIEVLELLVVDNVD